MGLHLSPSRRGPHRVSPQSGTSPEANTVGLAAGSPLAGGLACIPPRAGPQGTCDKVPLMAPERRPGLPLQRFRLRPARLCGAQSDGATYRHTSRWFCPTGVLPPRVHLWRREERYVRALSLQAAAGGRGPRFSLCVRRGWAARPGLVTASFPPSGLGCQAPLPLLCPCPPTPTLTRTGTGMDGLGVLEPTPYLC